jgi:hypothetical protein
MAFVVDVGGEKGEERKEESFFADADIVDVNGQA